MFPIIAWDMVLVTTDVFHLLSGIGINFKVAGVVREGVDAHLLQAP